MIGIANLSDGCSFTSSSMRYYLIIYYYFYFIYYLFLSPYLYIYIYSISRVMTCLNILGQGVYLYPLMEHLGYEIINKNLLLCNNAYTMFWVPKLTKVSYIYSNK